MTTATYALDVNWNGDGTTWIDEVANLISCEWRRGRDYASQLTGHASAGQLVAELQNPAGRYAPLNSAGALYGNLLPGRKVRLRTYGKNSILFGGTNGQVKKTGLSYTSPDEVSFEWRHKPNGSGDRAVLKYAGHLIQSTTDAITYWVNINSQTDAYNRTNVNNWEHVILTFSFLANEAKVYVDGSLVRTTVITVAKDPATFTYLSAGAYNDSRYFLGEIDFVRIYHRIIGSTEATARAAGVYSNEANLQLLWNFNEGSGTTTADESPNGWTGTLSGDTTWASAAATAATLWRGFLSEIAPDPGSRDSIPTARIRAIGPLGYLADKKASTAVFTSILSGTAIGKVLDDAGWPAGDRTLDAGQITMSRWKADGDLALNHIREIEETEIAYVGETKDGKIVFEDQQHRLSPPYTVSQATFSDASGASLPYEAIAEMDPWREVFNIFSADVTTYTTQTLAVLWTMTGETPSIGAGATKEFWAIYPTSDQPAQADHVDAWTTTAATTDMLANTQADGLGVNKTGSMTIVCTKFANSMKIALTNTDAGAVFITFLQARGTGVYRNDPIRVLVEDATSQTKFGKRSYPLPGKFYPTTVVAKSYVDLGLARYKDQLAIVAITYQANLSDAHMAQMIARNISDRISLVAQGSLASGAQLGINYDFFIESERHSLSNVGHWVTYELSDARFDAGYWLLGTGQLGSTTKLAA